LCYRYPKYLETFPEEVKEEKTVLDPNEQETLQLKKMKMRKKTVSSLMCSNKYVF
jgi:hypothetical protein